MRVLVTGATGFIGLEVARRLADAGRLPRLMVRRVSRAPLVASLDAEVVHGDLRSRPSLRRALAGIDAVIHLAGRATFEPYAKLAPTLVDGTRTLMEEAIHAGVSNVAFGSSALVYRGDGEIIDESTRVDPHIDYGRAKVDAEEVLAELGAAAGVSVGSLRLPHVYGPHSLLFGMIRNRVVPFPGSGTNHFAHMHVADAADALIAAVERPPNTPIPVADHGSFTWNEFFEILGSYAPGVRVLRLPRALSQLGARVVGRPLGSLGPTMISPDTIRSWNQDIRIDPGAGWRGLGIEPRFSTLLEGIPATLDDVVAFRWRHPVWDRT
ncbi:MAG: NAD-dependent epimerase/dehydratase family protein [Acidimicrobiales bacterium]